MACINLAMHSAITTDKTYLADKESTQQKFIGYGAGTPRASEFFQRIGNEPTLSLKMAKACVTHLEDGEILALDGTQFIAILKISVLRQSARKKMVRMALRSTFR